MTHGFANIDVANLISLKAAAGDAEMVFDAEAADGKPRIPSFSMTAYNGGPFNPGGWYAADPIIVDLAGMSVPASVPIDMNHDTEIGHTTKIEKQVKSLRASGLLSSWSADENDAEAMAARLIVRKSRNAFPFQASMEFAADRASIKHYRAGESVQVNGRTFHGPVYVAEKSSLHKIAILSRGADDTTHATISAKPGDSEMDQNFLKWLQAKGMDAAAFNALPSAAQLLVKGGYDESIKAAPATVPPPAPVDPVAALTAKFAAEADRCNQIAAICLKAKNPEIEVGGVKVSLQAHAIAENWTVEKTQMKAQEIEIERLRAERVQAPFGYVASSPTGAAMTNDVLTAALCRSRNIPGVDKSYKPEVLEAADRIRNLGPQQLFLTVAMANGYNARPGERINAGNIREVMQYAFRAGFSSLSLPGILGNVANKDIAAGYMQEDQTWREISKVVSVANFYQQTVYRMLDDMEYEQLGPGGEIKHGSADEESYTRQADTYAKMFTLTRKSIINDDLGAFDDLRSRIGRGGAKKFNNVFWTEFMSNAATFWTTARTNYITGATTTLLVDGVGLGLGVKAFRQMTSPTADGTKRVGGQPMILLVPPELEAAARVLFTERGGQNIATAGNANPWSGLYRPVVSAWLSDSNYTGYSTTAWFMLRDPMDLAAVHVSFLNGVQIPTVESADADFNTLGVQFRGYHDFGCDQAEYLAGVKSKGAA